jgi:hypothetical protein
MKEKVTPTQKALNLWAVILIIWSIYRSFFNMPEWFDEFVAKPAVFVLPVLYYIRIVDKKGIMESLYINLSGKKFVSDVVYSIMAVVLFFGAALLAIYMKTGSLPKPNLPNAQAIAIIVILAVATGITEEILSRGFVLKKLYDESKNYFSAIFLSSILFFILHVPILFTNVDITGNLLLTFMVTDMVLSIINGFIFIERKSLTVPIFIHAFYNIMVSLMFL